MIRILRVVLSEVLKCLGIVFFVQYFTVNIVNSSELVETDSFRRVFVNDNIKCSDYYIGYGNVMWFCNYNRKHYNLNCMPNY